MVLPLRDENPTRVAPVVTIAIIVACIAVFAFVQHGDGGDAAFLYEHAAVPCEVVHDRPVTVLEVDTNIAHERGGPYACNHAPPAPAVFPHKHVYLSILVSMFLHGSWLHVLGNMLYLWIFGNNVEDRLRPFGFAIFYVAGGVVALATHVALNSSSVEPVVGASGAIAAVMGAYFVWYPRARVLSVIPPLFFLPFYLPAWLVLGGWFVLQFFTDPTTGVAWAAHVGGFVFGVLVGLAFASRTAHRAPQHRLATPAHHDPPSDGWWPGGYRGPTEV